MDRITKEQRSLTMSKIRSKNTKPEKAVFKVLKNNCYQFKRHSSLTGKPDVQLVTQKIVIFVDGEFWHGKDFNEWKNRITPFWLKKISDNIKRDRKNDRTLRKQGWTIIHLWGREIVKNPDKVLTRIRKITQKNHIT
jgi:DNA mismatch endonuclease, patch repair protein